MGAGERLRAARLRAGYRSAKSAAEAMGVNRFTYAQHENETRAVPRQAAVQYAQFFHVSLDFLLVNGSNLSYTRLSRVVAIVGPGGGLLPVEDSKEPDELEQVSAPSGINHECTAARVLGDSMYPMLENGWLIFWQPDTQGVSEDCIDKLCVVKLERGPTLLRRVRRGNSPDRWHLESYNAPLQADERLEWASRVIDIRPT